MRGIGEDLRFTLRTLARRPAFTAVAVVTLALGIGANSAIFSVINSLLLRPLPLPDPGRLVYVGEYYADTGEPGVTSWLNFVDMNERWGAAEGVAAWWAQQLTVAGGEPFRIDAAVVTTNYLQVLGAAPMLGPGFDLTEGPLSVRRTVVLSEGLWRARFGADETIIGDTISLDGHPSTVVGVMPASSGASPLDFGEPVQLWRAVTADDLGAYRTIRGARWLRTVARLAEGVGPAEAQAELDALFASIRVEHPDQGTANWSAHLTPLHEFLVRDARMSMLVLLGAVTLVLLIAVANVANLELVRAESRTQEVAVRAALGASRWRLARLLLVEALCLSVAGGALGAGLAALGLCAVRALPTDLGLPLAAVTVDVEVLAFTLAVSVLCGLVFGLAPVATTLLPSLAAFLREGGRNPSGGGRGRLRGSLVVAEIALALALLAGAALLISSFARLVRVDPGFVADRILTASVTLPQGSYGEAHLQAQAFRTLVERVRAIPGVEAAGAESNLPLASGMGDRGFTIEGRPRLDGEQPPLADFSRATPGYFETMGIPLVSGRGLRAGDTSESARVVVLNQTAARRYWPDGDPVGQRISFTVGGDEGVHWHTVVGVVGDVRHRSLDGPVGPRMYVPQEQAPVLGLTLVLRTAGDPLAVAGAVRDAVRGFAPDLAVAEIRTMNQVVAASLASQRLMMGLLGGFAGIAVLLAAVGTYGVVSTSVSRRTHEIGLRMALGADRGAVLRLVVGDGLRLVGLGVAAGLAGALLAGRLIAGLLYGVAPADPLVLAGISVLLTAVTLVACFLPARWASRLEPMEVLRHE